MLAGFPAVAEQKDDLHEADDAVAIEWRRNDAGVRGIRASFLVRSTREALWAVLLDYDRFPRIFRDVRQAKVIRELPEGAEVDFIVNAKIQDFRFILERRYLERGKRITWKKISGDLGTIEGGWTIEDGPKPDLLRLTYESYVEVGWYVPEFAARLSAADAAREMARALRAHLGEVQHASQPNLKPP